jgi:hypothetical protein
MASPSGLLGRLILVVFVVAPAAGYTALQLHASFASADPFTGASAGLDALPTCAKIGLRGLLL